LYYICNVIPPIYKGVVMSYLSSISPIQGNPSAIIYESTQASPTSRIERRAAIEIGSGCVRMQVADVDIRNNIRRFYPPF